MPDGEKARRRRRKLRLVLVSLAIAAAGALAVWGYLTAFTDVLVLRQTPVDRLSSPDGSWELRVYDVEPSTGSESHDALWVAAVAPRGSGQEQRVVYKGLEVAFAWDGPRTLLASEYTDVPQVHRIDVRTGSYGVHEPWDGLRLVATFYAFVPALLALLAGLAVAMTMPGLLWRRQGVVGA